MAKVRNNIITQGLSGMLGDQIVFRTGRNGRTIVATKPSYSTERVLSSVQLAHMEAFRQAIAYAKSAKDEVIYITKAHGTALTPYNVAVADWFSKPEVLEIDTTGWTGAVGELVRIKAMEEMQVAKVTVVIKHMDGTVIEQGQAVQSGLAFVFGNGNAGWKIWKDGNWEILVTSNNSPNTEGHVTVDVKGSTFTASASGISPLVITDSSISNGLVALGVSCRFQNGCPQFDNFSVISNP